MSKFSVTAALPPDAQRRSAVKRHRDHGGQDQSRIFRTTGPQQSDDAAVASGKNGPLSALTWALEQTRADGSRDGCEDKGEHEHRARPRRDTIDAHEFEHAGNQEQGQ